MPVEFVYIKDPQASLDYSFDWTDWLGGGEYITGTSWTVPAGVSKVGSETFSTTISTCRISGGTIGNTYTVTCQISTNTGEVDQRSLNLVIQER